MVDDNPLVRQVLCDTLRGETDFEVCGQASNGREAIEQAQRLHPDLVVTDLAMPIMDGLEEARLLKKLLPEVRVIIYTVHAGMFVEQEARSAGVSAVISKADPVSALIATARTLSHQAAA